MEAFEPFVGYYFFNILLIVLQALHVFWAVLILRMVYKFLKGKVRKFFFLILKLFSALSYMFKLASAFALSWKRMNAVMTRVILKRKRGIKEERKMQFVVKTLGREVKTA